MTTGSQNLLHGTIDLLNEVIRMLILAIYCTCGCFLAVDCVSHKHTYTYRNSALIGMDAIHLEKRLSTRHARHLGLGHWYRLPCWHLRPWNKAGIGPIPIPGPYHPAPTFRLSLFEQRNKMANWFAHLYVAKAEFWPLSLNFWPPRLCFQICIAFPHLYISTWEKTKKWSTNTMISDLCAVSQSYIKRL